MVRTSRLSARETRAGLERTSKSQKDTLKEGWLMKYSVSAPAAFKNWKRRWLIVQPGLIGWVDKPAEGIVDAKSLPLRKGTLVSINKGNQIQILTPAAGGGEGTKLLLKATTPAEAEEWRAVLLQAVNAEEGGTSGPETVNEEGESGTFSDRAASDRAAEKARAEAKALEDERAAKESAKEMAKQRALAEAKSLEERAAVEAKAAAEARAAEAKAQAEALAAAEATAAAEAAERAKEEAEAKAKKEKAEAEEAAERAQAAALLVETADAEGKASAAKLAEEMKAEAKKQAKEAEEAEAEAKKAAEKELVERQKAAIAVQSAARGRVDRGRTAQKKREHAAAQSLQAAARGRSARAEQRSMLAAKKAEQKAAIAMQSVARGRNARKEADAAKAAAEKAAKAAKTAAEKAEKAELAAKSASKGDASSAKDAAMAAKAAAASAQKEANEAASAFKVAEAEVKKAAVEEDLASKARAEAEMEAREAKKQMELIAKEEAQKEAARTASRASFSAAQALFKGSDGGVSTPRPAALVKAIRENDWAAAEKIARTAQEKQDVADSKTRVQTMQALMQEERYNDALRLAIMQSEVDEITELMVRRGDIPHFFKCFKPKAPQDRPLELVAAIRAYDWTLASSLAMTAEERQDVEDSIARVDMLLKLKAAGRYGEALDYAILQSEVDELQKLKEEYGDGRGNCFTRCFSLVHKEVPPVRTPQFIDAINNYDWPRAAELVTTLEERQDLDDSIARVDEMLRLKASGRYDEALKLAILKREAEDINSARKVRPDRPRRYTGEI
ncbi:hypothetical protein AB1Y20_021745 [Prymnesium parvum]|uniref:PH domain-containing protein n=1 Tax=Prymnesium parvum TaxID=97485 RepID=A0AB34JLH7_PRYPA